MSYENILKRTGAGGRPVAKPLIRKFVAKAAPVHDAPPSGHAGAEDSAADPPVAPAAEGVERPSAAAAPPAPPTPPPAKQAGKAAQTGKGKQTR